MQQTFHKPTETEGQHGLRMASSMSQDYEFADYSMADYDERAGYIQSASRSTVWFVKNLFFYTKKRWILRVGWIFEFIVNVALLTVAGMTIRSSCLIEFGVEVMCYTCYGLPFLVWIASFSLLWLLNTYMHVLLISRGFAFPRNISLVLEDNRRKGIPGIAVIVFMFLLVLMFTMVVGGIVMLVHSNSCPTVDHIAGVRTLKRSENLFWAIIIAMIIACITLPVIRFSEVFFAKKEPKEQVETPDGQKYGTFHKYMDMAKEKGQPYMDKFREKRQYWANKAHDKEQQYMDNIRDRRDHLVDKLHQKEEKYANKFHEKMDPYANKFYEKKEQYLDPQINKLRNHGQYLDSFQPKEHGALTAQSL